MAARSAAERMQAHRHRRRIGLEIYAVEVSSFLVLNYLIDAGRLSEVDCKNRDKVGAALSVLIAEVTRKKR